MIDSARLGLPEFVPGSVWLVGAGPGDPGLLSALALHALDHAAIVVYDALVDPRILALARTGAALDHAGKRGGRPSPSQPDISARLIRLAQEGRRVLRLKGGDPCVFGRGGEEALALAEAGIPFRIVPGITAGIGGLAYAGIPVTHRDINSAVTFVTGHSSGGAVPDEVDWEAIARGSPVIVLYMGLRHIAAIAARLIAAGRASIWICGRCGPRPWPGSSRDWRRVPSSCCAKGSWACSTAPGPMARPDRPRLWRG